MGEPIKSLEERLQEFYSRLAALPPARSPDEALEQVAATLDAVEDAYSGVPKKIPPPPPNMPDGRMYPPLADFITRDPDGSVTARTRGHRVEIGADGSVRITNLRTGALELEKPGGKT